MACYIILFDQLDYCSAVSFHGGESSLYCCIQLNPASSSPVEVIVNSRLDWEETTDYIS